METKEKLLSHNFEAGLVRIKRQMDSFIDTLYFRELRNTGLESFASSVMFPTQDHLEKYLKKRGYTLDRVSGEFCYKKDFTCVRIRPDGVYYWHDISVGEVSWGHIPPEKLVELPDALNYMERI